MDIAGRISEIKCALPPDVELVAVSKFHPAQDLMEAYAAGQRIFAESRPQELFAKVKEIQGVDGDGRASAYPNIQWHFIGHLQTNKLKLVLPYISMVQSVDSLHLLEAISKWGLREGRVTDVLLEVHIAKEETKQGFSEDEVAGILSRTGDFPSVRFRGLMGMATLTDDESVLRSDFSRLKSLFDRMALMLSSTGTTCFDQLSMGMSEDYRIALEYGTTMVRIGTAIFGPRVY